MAEANPNCPGCARLRKELEELRAEVERLSALVKQSSRNSSRPPSSDRPGTVARSKTKSKRRPGGQPGHEGTTRMLVAPDHIQEHKPDQCAKCGHGLTGSDPRPLRHQVVECPPIKAEVTEHQLHALRCCHCGTTTRAELPVGIPRGAFGPGLQALVALFIGVYRVSRRNVEQILQDCFGVNMALGSISRIEQTMSAALEEPVAEVAALVRGQPVVHMDETGWREAGKRAWLWTAVTELATLFVIRLSRGGAVAREVLGEAFAGILVSDRWSGYGWIDKARRQLCWAHLIRDFRKMAELGSVPDRWIGMKLGRLAKQLFESWHRVRDGTMARTAFQDRAGEIRAGMQCLLRVGSTTASGVVASKCTELLKLEEAMWTFVTHEGVEPTNNPAEQAVRAGVIWRKTSLGTQSPAGSQFAERMLTVAATLRKQGRNVLEYLTAASNAHLLSQPSPSLLPVSDPQAEAA